MSTRDKGNRVQRKCIEHLEEQGFLVGKVEAGGKFAKVKDLFGLFDLVAIHPNKEINFVQVTTNRPHTHKNFEEFSKKYNLVGTTYKQYVWYDRKGWKIFTYVGGKKLVKDYR